MAKEYKLSAAHLESLKKEFAYLKTVRGKEIADQFKEARSFGDLSENSEYNEAKEEHDKLYHRIAELEDILSNYSIIEEQDSAPNTVQLGSKVTVLDVDAGDEEEYQIVGSQEANPMDGRISEESPFGNALLGKTIGETIIVEAPIGSIEYRVVDIRR